jgi:hypothetical protein
MTTALPNPNRFFVEVVSSSTICTSYFESTRINIRVTNSSKESTLLESATLQFQPDTGAAPNYVDFHPGLRLSPKESKTVEVDVTPVPSYQEYTNQFKIRLKGHAESRGRLGDSFSELHGGFYIIINPSAASLGEVFVSFKQPEDQRIANILERYARRAGFTPRLFMRRPELGEKQWEQIETLIGQCHSVVIVWGLRTEWGEGVEREIDLCRKHCCREILLIAEGVEPPKNYDSTIAYQRFDPVEPAEGLSRAMASLRDQVVKSSAP